MSHEAKNSISEPVVSKLLGEHAKKFAFSAPTKFASSVMKVCLAVALCHLSFDGGGGVAIVPY